MTRSEAARVALAARRANGVPVEPLAEAFRRSGRTSYEIARDFAWTRSYQRGRLPDGGRVLRALGLKAYSPGRGYPPRRREFICAELALKLADAIGVDPVDVGL